MWQSRPGSPISPAPPREAWRPRPGGEAGLGRLGHLLLAVPRPRCQGGWACVGVPKAAPGPSSLLGRDSAVPAAEAPGQLQTPAHSSLPLLPLGVLTGAAWQPATRRQVPPVCLSCTAWRASLTSGSSSGHPVRPASPAPQGWARGARGAIRHRDCLPTRVAALSERPQPCSPAHGDAPCNPAAPGVSCPLT